MGACLLLWLVFALPLRCVRSFASNLPYGYPRERAASSLPYSDKSQHGAAKSDEDNATPTLRPLYPPISSYADGKMIVDSIHTLFYREYGNSNGLPALFLHGGPGAGCFDNHARFFDPKQYRIVLLDQRGAGASTPRAEWRQNNTLLHLVGDCEKLRQRLSIDQWTVVLGGSWGSTLGLAYAAIHPFAMKFLLLRGICLMRRHEIDWLFSYSSPLADVNAEEWKRFGTACDVPNGEDPRRALHVHYDGMFGDDPLNRIDAARSWMMHEFSVEALNKEKLNPNASTLVGSRDGDWFYHDKQMHLFKSLPTEEVETILGEMRRYTADKSTKRPGASTLDPILREPAPMPPHVNISTANITEATRFVPAQAMLTCFFSVNTEYAMNGVPLLHRIAGSCLRDSVRCIGVHGGLDNICPVDTALDLKHHWPEMELRIPLGAGHSMYDAAITHELIQATDRIADQAMMTKEGNGKAAARAGDQ